MKRHKTIQRRTSQFTSTEPQNHEKVQKWRNQVSRSTSFNSDNPLKLVKNPDFDNNLNSNISNELSLLATPNYEESNIECNETLNNENKPNIPTSHNINYEQFIFSSDQGDDVDPKQLDIPPKPSLKQLKSTMKLVPIDNAKEQILALMKTQNDEYIRQIDTLHNSQKALNKIRQDLRKMGPVKIDIRKHPIRYEIAMHNYTIEHCTKEIERIKTNIDYYAQFHSEIEMNIQKQKASEQQKKFRESTQNENAQKSDIIHSSVSLPSKLRLKEKIRSKTLSPKKSGANTPQLNSNSSQQQTPTPPANSLFVDVSSFFSNCITVSENPNIFMERSAALKPFFTPFPLSGQIHFFDPEHPDKKFAGQTNSPNTDDTITEKKSAFYIKNAQDAKEAYIINPAADKDAFLLSTIHKPGRIIERFRLQINEIEYSDIDVISDALYELTKDYLTKFEIIDTLFGIAWTMNPTKYPIVPSRNDHMWIPYVYDLIPAALNPPFLEDKWKHMSFQELFATKDWPLKEAVESLLDLFLTSNPFKIASYFENTIQLIANAAAKMLHMEIQLENVEIDFDQLFSLLIICVFASGLISITEPLWFSYQFNEWADEFPGIQFAMSHMEGLRSFFLDLNYMELREKSNRLKKEYEEKQAQEKKK